MYDQTGHTDTQEPDAEIKPGVKIEPPESREPDHEWTPDRVRERLSHLGLSETATDDEIEHIADTIISEIPSVEVPAALQQDLTLIEASKQPLPIPDHLKGKPCRCLDPDCTVPYGICHCGCGRITGPYSSTDRRFGRVKGEAALCLARHTFKQGTNQLATPYLAAWRRASGAAAWKANAPSRTRKAVRTVDENGKRGRGFFLGPITLEMLSAMYHEFVATVAEDGKSRLSAYEALERAGLEKFGRYASKYGANMLFKHLVAEGYVKSHGPRYKEPLRAPGGSGDMTPAVIEKPSKPEKKAEVLKPDTPTHTDALNGVTGKELADALANAMWTRYEWVLGELGNAREALAAAQEAIAVRDTEIARLQSMVEEPDSIELARRILGDATAT